MSAGPDLSFLLSLRKSDPTPLALSDYARLAAKFGCEVEVLKAVAEVESGRFGAFGSDGRPIIAYERHRFHHYTEGRFGIDAEISNPSRGNWTTDQGAYWDRLARAYALDAEAALKSVSWGRFQLMGENFDGCGYADVREYVRDLSTSELKQFEGFEKFIEMKHLEDELRAKNWDRIAHHYNGPANVREYSERMRTAYAALSRA